MLALRLVLTEAPADPGVRRGRRRHRRHRGHAPSVGRWPAWATDHQVLVVTHLPQVAAFADAQVVVAQGRATGGRRRRRRTVARRAERVVEIARMLSGSPDSATARAATPTELLIAGGHDADRAVMSRARRRRAERAPAASRSGALR